MFLATNYLIAFLYDIDFSKDFFKGEWKDNIVFPLTQLIDLFLLLRAVRIKNMRLHVNMYFAV
jgi:hypothetical protein